MLYLTNTWGGVFQIDPVAMLALWEPPPLRANWLIFQSLQQTENQRSCRGIGL